MPDAWRGECGRLARNSYPEFHFFFSITCFVYLRMNKDGKEEKVRGTVVKTFLRQTEKYVE